LARDLQKPLWVSASFFLTDGRPTGASIRFREAISSFSDDAERLPFARNSGSVFRRAPHHDHFLQIPQFLTRSQRYSNASRQTGSFGRARFGRVNCPPRNPRRSGFSCGAADRCLIDRATHRRAAAARRKFLRHRGKCYSGRTPSPPRAAQLAFPWPGEKLARPKRCAKMRFSADLACPARVGLAAARNLRGSEPTRCLPPAAGNGSPRGQHNRILQGVLRCVRCPYFTG